MSSAVAPVKVLPFSVKAETVILSRPVPLNMNDEYPFFQQAA